MDTNDLQKKIESLEAEMVSTDFWNNKLHAQEVLKELRELKDKKEGSNAFDRGGALLSILSGAGGDDAEDFSAMLLHMYIKYFEKKGWSVSLIHENKNDNDGYRNISIEVIGQGVYGALKRESGVHRLVRLSPFNAKQKRNTSFSLVEVVPKIAHGQLPEIKDSDIKVEFSKSGGPGGQNVNKRETAVRATHTATGITVHVTSERSQEQNKQKAIELVKGKLFAKAEAEKKSLEESMQIAKTTDIEWGNQIRNYVLHPYKLVKDLRTGIETGDADAVLERGELDEFIEAQKKL
jgi:peptide chain release factor 2